MPTFTPGPGSSKAKDGTEVAEKVTLPKSTSFTNQDSMVSAPDMEVTADLQRHAEQLVTKLRNDPSLRVSACDLDMETQDYLMQQVGSQVTVADVVKSMREAEKANQDAQIAQNATRMWKKLALWLAIVCVVLLLGMFSTTVGAIQLTKEIRATNGGVLQTQDGDTALVGSSDTEVCAQGELCSRNTGLAISTATVSVSLSFRKLASAASNLTLITPLLTDATAVSHLNPYGETEQTKVRRAAFTLSESGNQVSLSLEASDGLVHGATLQIGKSTTTYTSSDETYDTSGQVFFQLTPRSESSWQAILAMQGIRRLQAAPDDDEPLAASNARLAGLHGKAIDLNAKCASMLMRAFSKEVMETPALDSFDSQKVRQNYQSFCNLKCQPDIGCIVASGHCTSQVFRALDEANQSAQLLESCEHVLQTQASVHSAEEEINEELEETNAKNNATFAYGGGRRLGEEPRRLWWGRRRQSWGERLAGYGAVGCCSTGIGMVGGNDAAGCVDSPYLHETSGWKKSISSCCWYHDQGTRENTYFVPSRTGMKSRPPSDCNRRGLADHRLKVCADGTSCPRDWNWVKCQSYTFIISKFMKGRPNKKSPKGASAC